MAWTDRVVVPGRLRLPGRAVAPLLVAVLVVAGAVGLARLDDQPLWYDELASEWASSLSWVRLDALLGVTDANIGPYYALLHLWRDVVGAADWTLRLPSVVGFVATVLLTARLGQRWLGRRAGLLPALFVAVHPFAVAYARDARPYALVTATVLASTLVAVRLRDLGPRDRARRRLITLYALASCVSVALHLYSVLVLAVVALALLPAAGRERRQWLAVHVPVGLVTAVVLVVSLRQRGQLAWVPPITPSSLVGGASLLAGGPLVLAATVVAALVVARSRVFERRTTLLLLGVLVVPLAALAAASVLAPTFVPRYLEPVVPFQALVLAGAVVALRHRAARLLAAVATAAVLGAGALSVVAASYQHEDYRLASQELLSRARPGDGAVWADTSVRLGMSYYLPREAAATGRAASVPTDLLALPHSQTVGFRVPQATGAAATRTEDRYRRVWVVSYAGRPLPTLDPRFRCEPGSPHGGLLVRLCVNTAP
ncbi:glycosyltransferase family 39 protein [Pedococcus sp. NPDC057267]|uniref:glycosyltransferase family 39 protein n=1 Tax=Pedococcus sp. NPDC057267 TaxID=3346077 RepID=UPI00363DA568